MSDDGKSRPNALILGLLFKVKACRIKTISVRLLTFSKIYNIMFIGLDSFKRWKNSKFGQLQKEGM